MQSDLHGIPLKCHCSATLFRGLNNSTRAIDNFELRVMRRVVELAIDNPRRGLISFLLLKSEISASRITEKRDYLFIHPIYNLRYQWIYIYIYTPYLLCRMLPLTVA